MDCTDFNSLSEAVLREPLQREIKYRILSFCRSARKLEEIEAEVAQMPQFKTAAQNQYRMVETLENAGGLRRIELDSSGEEIDPELKARISEDEASDLVADVLFETTAEGLRFVDEYSPARRFERLLADEPNRKAPFFAVLEFCKGHERPFSQIVGFLRDEGYSQPGFGTAGTQPSVFLDRLERSGLIEWDDGWITTKEGEDCLSARAV